MQHLPGRGGPFSTAAVLLAVVLITMGLFTTMSRGKVNLRKGYDIVETGLFPRYPSGYTCSPLTSLYASMIDVDGSARDSAHSGVDGGQLGDPILAPAGATVEKVWEADWGWGSEGALLLRHTRADLNARGGPPYYYSAFYHLKLEHLAGLADGHKVARGQVLAYVHRPGGKRSYLPEVHWEVYEVDDVATIEWETNALGRAYWENPEARLVDPLYLLSLEVEPDDDGGVEIQPYEAGRRYDRFRGFTYILPCRRQR